MQRFLIQLTPAQVEQQHQRLADEVAAAAAAVAAAAAAAAARAPPRGPGRPRSATSVTTLASACSPSSSDDDADDAAAVHSRKRGYTPWLTSDSFHLIHDAVRRRQSFRGAVRDLQQRFPRLPTQQHGTFDLLHAATLRHWYSRDSTRAITLKHEYERFLGSSAVVASAPSLAGGGGPQSWWKEHPEATQAIQTALQALRDEDRAGIAVGLRLVRWTVAAVAEKLQLPDPPLSNSSLSQFVHRHLNWTWRCRTTAAGKLPDDWQAQGTQMAQRIAVHIELSEVDESLIINWDQTGVILIPAATRTYEKQGETRVAVLGADEKRQITAVLASSMQGEMLPLQLIFAGKTERSRPAATAASIAAGFHLTSSDNHWSTQQTMKEYIEHIIEPYRQRKIKEKGLKPDSRMVLVLDAWSVHRSDEFRTWIAKNHPLMHLVFVPANCTSHLQVADVVLQKSFKAKLRDRFSEWAATLIKQQALAGDITGLRTHLGLKELRPLVLDWCLFAWTHLASPEGKMLIISGWFKCVLFHYNVRDPLKRKEAVELAARGVIKAYNSVPQEDEAQKHEDDIWRDSDAEEEELDLTKPKADGERKSKRAKLDRQPQIGSYMLDSSQIELSDED